MVKARNWDELFVGSVVDCSGDPGRTKQADAAACDINNILKRYEKTGILPGMIRENPSYGDFSEAPDFQEALNLVRDAERQFGALDAPIRSRFDNDPAKFLEFVHNPSNIEEMANLGLLKPEVVKARNDAAAKAAKEAVKDSKPA